MIMDVVHNKSFFSKRVAYSLFTDRLMTLANYAMKLEREVWGVLSGPWGSDTWMSWRRDWAQKVRTATTAEPVAHAIVELVAQLQSRALNPRWALHLQPRFTRALLRKGPALGGSAQRGFPSGAGDHKALAKQKSGVKPLKAITKVASKSGRLNRSSSNATDAPSASRRRNYKEESDSAPSESDEEEAHDPFAADDLDDPTIVDSTGQTNRAGWALNQPSRWEGDLQGGPKLPRERAKQLGRRGGTVRVTGVKYNTKQLVIQPRLSWMGAMQAVKTAPELALQLRKLDSNVQWEALKRPLGEDFPYASAEILDRRPASPSTDSAAASPTAAATASASASATNGSNPDDAAATGLTGRWEYLLQSSHGEVLPDGLGSAQHAQRQPLQPLSQLQGQLQQPQGLLQQPQVEKTQALADTFATQFQQSGLNSVGNAHLQQQQQHPQHMSVLPNDAVAQQQQQAAGPPADKQIAVQKAVSLLSSHELPEQAQLAAQSANGVPAEDSTAGQITAEQKNAAHQSADGTAALHDSAQRAQHVEQAHVASTVPNGQQQPQLPSAPLHDPSATPYAPVANGMPQPSGLLASLVPALSQRPLSAGAATADRLGQLAPALPQGFANSPALSREGTPAVKPQPLWVHEDKLPLWLVKAYEEKRRRDVSMVAARAAQQAQRDANAANRASGGTTSSYTPTITLKTKRQEAKAAAEAAAAAAADACALCGLLYGDDAVKDDFWIACDKCNRWYHGVCVELTQERADAMEEAKWECPDCSALKNERRRLAVDRARQRRATQGKALVRFPLESEPGSEDALTASRKEAKKGRRPAATSKKSKKRKATEDPDTALGPEEEGQAAEPQELYCLCRQPDDPTRDYIECTDCAQWYHPECVGASIEEVEASDKYTCPLCTRALQKEERKRQRQAEAAAAADLDREAREAQAARKAKLAELDMSDWPRNWQGAVQRVLENVLKLPEAFPFAEPVPIDEVPGYRDLISTPMDLGTVLGRSKADNYDTPLEALADVRQVWANCRIYNAEGSQIWQVCADAESAFDLNWSSARLPLPPAPPLPPQPKRQSKADPSSSGQHAPHVKIKLTIKPSKQQPQEEEEEQPSGSGSDAEISDSDEPGSPQAGSKKGTKRKASKISEEGQHSSAAELKLAQKVVKGLTKLQSAAPFLAPVSEEDAPGYHAVVKEPMDLGTVLGKLKSGAYTSLGSILRDVDVVWANCRAFNEPDSDICALADEAQQALRIRWQQAGLPTVTPSGPSSSLKKTKGKKRILEETLPADLDPADDTAGDESGPKRKKQKGAEHQAGTQAESSSADELKRALKAVKGLSKLKVAAPFTAPVSEEEVPGYHDVVTEPMDLQSVADKLQQHQYASIGEVYGDVELVWANCRAFNEPDSDICNQAAEAEQAFKSKWQQQDLPVQDTRPAKKKSKGKSAKLQSADSSAAKQEAVAAADDKGSKKKQKGSSKLESERQPSKKDKSSRDSAAARKSKRAADADASDDSGSDTQPRSADAAKSPQKRKGQHRKGDADKQEQQSQPNSSGAKSPDKGRPKSKGTKPSLSGAETSAQPGARKKRLSGGEEDEGTHSKQKKSKSVQETQHDVGRRPKASDASKKLTASERLRQGLPPTPGSRSSARRGDA